MTSVPYVASAAVSTRTGPHARDQPLPVFLGEILSLVEYAQAHDVEPHRHLAHSLNLEEPSGRDPRPRARRVDPHVHIGHSHPPLRSDMHRRSLPLIPPGVFHAQVRQGRRIFVDAHVRLRPGPADPRGPTFVLALQPCQTRQPDGDTVAGVRNLTQVEATERARLLDVTRRTTSHLTSLTVPVARARAPSVRSPKCGSAAPSRVHRPSSRWRRNDCVRSDSTASRSTLRAGPRRRAYH